WWSCGCGGARIDSSRRGALDCFGADFLECSLDIGAQAEKLLEGLTNRAFRVFLLEGLLPLVGHFSDFDEWFRGRQTAMMAIENANTCGVELAQSPANSDQVGMHQFNQRAAKEEIEADEGDHRGRLVKAASQTLLELAALIDEVSFQDFAQTTESAQRGDHFFEWLSPSKRPRVHIA